MIAITNRPIIIRIALLLALSVGIGVALQFLFKDDKDNIKPPMPAAKAAKTSDYTMTHFKLIIMDRDGKPTRIMYGDRLIHYPDDSSHVINQKTEVLSENNTIWIISSDKGDTKGTGDNIVLNGNVIVKSEPDEGMNLYTDKLYLNTVLSTAYTDKAVTIKTPDGGNTKAIGMDAKLKDKIINLHSEVIGYHDSPFSD